MAKKKHKCPECEKECDCEYGEDDCVHGIGIECDLKGDYKEIIEEENAKM